MKLVFLGTRGYIEARSRRHRRHSAVLVVYRGRRVLVDCGEDWRGRLRAIAPHAIALTHAHPDHTFGLDGGAPCPVHATHETWAALDHYPIEREKRWILRPRRPTRIAGIRFEAFPVIHSTRAPAVGYRIQAGRVAVFYAPDVVAIPGRAEAFTGIRLYVGDGAAVTRPLVRRERSTGALFGHTTIRAQLGWCAQEGVPRMVVTHCGTPLVAGDERSLGARIRRMGRERGVAVEVAHDGQELVLR